MSIENDLQRWLPSSIFWPPTTAQKACTRYSQDRRGDADLVPFEGVVDEEDAPLARVLEDGEQLDAAVDAVEVLGVEKHDDEQGVFGCVIDGGLRLIDQ